MSSLYTPVFANLKTIQPSFAPSSANPGSSSPDPVSSHSARLSSIHLALSRLDPVLCPPSPPYDHFPSSQLQHPRSRDSQSQHSTTYSPTRTSKIRAQVLDALDATDGERSSGKWGHVSNCLTLGCTRGKRRWGYQGFVGKRRRVREGNAEVERKWVLVDTEEDWFKLEREREGLKEEIVEEGKEGTLGVEERVKIWQQNLPLSLLGAPSSLPLPDLPPPAPQPAEDNDETPTNVRNSPKTKSQQSESNLVPAAKEKESVGSGNGTGKGKDKEKDPSPLGFPVVKRVSYTNSAKRVVPIPARAPPASRDARATSEEEPHGVGGGSGKPHVPAPASDTPDRADVNMGSPTALPDAPADQEGERAREEKVQEGDNPAPITKIGSESGVECDKDRADDIASFPKAVAKIGDVSELSFLPPSFPPSMKTSTPKLNTRMKPPPIVEPSSSSSLPFLDNDVPPPSSSPALEVEMEGLAEGEKKRGVKRLRSCTPPPPPPPPDAMQVSPQPDAVNDGEEPLKKARTMTPELEAAPPPSLPITIDNPSSSPVGGRLLVPSTPSPARASTPPPQVPDKILGLGLLVPSTPAQNHERDGDHPLPTLTELLASSRRSKTRPRPPSRKDKDKGELGDVPEGEESPTKDKSKCKEQANDRAHTPDRSAPKSMIMFSSPASGSPMTPSTMSHLIPIRSPATPTGAPFTFTQHPSGFAPDFVSSQIPSVIGFGNRLSRGGSGAGTWSSGGGLTIGYNSQFDVEGQVGRVSELLERDVDFEGWLRDVPGDEVCEDSQT